MAEPNYLLGKGERLVNDIEIKSGGDAKPLPYDFATAKKRLSPRLRKVAATFDALPTEACPNDEAVAAIALHPEQIAKSYYPNALLSYLGLRSVGSHTATVDIGKDGASQPAATTELYVAAPRDTFRQLADAIGTWTENVPWADDLQRITDIRVVPIDQRVKPIHSDESVILCEIVLHGAGESATAPAVLGAFGQFVKKLGLTVDIKRRIDTANLSFVAIRLPRQQVQSVAEFGFLRTVRLMPTLRQLQPAADLGHMFEPFEAPVEAMHVRDPNISVAVFDGGMPTVSALRHCVTIHEDIDGLGDPVEVYLQHGLAVTSALLFGPLREGETAGQPFAHVDHYRVLDESTLNDAAHELYTVLDRITGVLANRHYDYANISLGPEVPVDDDDVHPWTIKLDELATNGTNLIASAVGNSGRSPAVAKLNRIQPPSDGVNLLSVGACDGEGVLWRRAPYSSVGQGRCPGVVKPEGVAFGGCETDPFWVLDSFDPGLTWPTNGTSLAAPYALRAAIGVRAALGGDVLPLAAKALLIQSCENTAELDIAEVGFGRFCTDVEQLITCDNHSVHVIYQDTLEPKRWVQAAIPMLPADEMSGYVFIKATLCFATEVDSQHPSLYTRAGLDIVFRRDKYNIKEDKTTAQSTSFFRPIEGVSEEELRADWHKWETVRCAADKFQARTLKDPVLDIHYNPRTDGKDAKAARSIPYAMVISVTAPKVENFYNRVRHIYRQRLDVLRPRFRLPSGRV